MENFKDDSKRKIFSRLAFIKKFLNEMPGNFTYFLIQIQKHLPFSDILNFGTRIKNIILKVPELNSSSKKYCDPKRVKLLQAIARSHFAAKSQFKLAEFFSTLGLMESRDKSFDDGYSHEDEEQLVLLREEILCEENKGESNLD
ncbi:hypothetical protein BpHYR1_006002 [Brachionus plicatilis]|uniref:Uncharacterized protein n=1 Tax=Brachionus plicatilis TaxID=10195 RepID=A0A3M7SWQ1_BRAPC|nr:hypothetical protein BpHYR1_006002 [Brachionus plicatilis]